MHNLENIEEQIQSLTAPSFTVLNMEELLEKEFPAAGWMVDKLVPTPGLTFIAGKAGKGKSLLTLGIAKAVSDGTDVAGHFATRESGVLIIDEENQPSEVQKRVRLFQINRENPVHLMSMQGFRINDEKHIERVLEIALERNCGVVIIDSLVRTHSLDENQAKEMRQIRKGLSPLLEAGLAVIIIHHQGKLGADQREPGMRGSSELDAMAESVLMVSKEGRILTITQTKSRQSEAVLAFEVELIGDGEVQLDLLYRGLDSTNKVNIAKNAILELLTTASEPMNQSDICSTLSETAEIPTNKTRTALVKLVQAKEIVETKGSRGAHLYSLWQEEQK